MTETLLSVVDVAYAYRGNGWRLRPSSFCVAPGEILAILGPNGSGKSTLLKIAAGVLRPDGGRIALQGRDLALFNRQDMAKGLGYLPQQVEAQFDFSVEEVVAMGRFAHSRGGLGFLSREDLEVVTRSLRQTATERFRQRHLSRLSGGERQRVLLASAIAQEPRVLLLDEPTTALDIHHQMRFFSILADLVRGGMGVVVVTHDLNLASLFCGRVLLLKEGCIHREGDPQAIFTRAVLEEVYGEGLEVLTHPTLGRPVVLPTRCSETLTRGAS